MDAPPEQTPLLWPLPLPPPCSGVWAQVPWSRLRAEAEHSCGGHRPLTGKSLAQREAGTQAGSFRQPSACWRQVESSRLRGGLSLPRAPRGSLSAGGVRDKPAQGCRGWRGAETPRIPAENGLSCVVTPSLPGGGAGVAWTPCGLFLTESQRTGWGGTGQDGSQLTPTWMMCPRKPWTLHTGLTSSLQTVLPGGGGRVLPVPI